MARGIHCAALSLALVPAACALPQESATPTSPRAGSPRIATPGAVRAVEGAWSFSFENGVCTATVAHRSAGLTITVGPTAVMRLATRLSAPSGAAASTASGRSAVTGLGFTGPSGNWTSRMGREGGAGVAEAPLDAAAETRLRALLAGGTLRLTSGNAPLAVLTLPDSGVAGREWFGCVSQLRG